MTVHALALSSTTRSQFALTSRPHWIKRMGRAATRAMLTALPVLMALLVARNVHGSITVESVPEPLFVRVDLGPVNELSEQDSPQWLQRVNNVSREILNAAARNPGRLVVIRTGETAISYDGLTGDLRKLVPSKPGEHRETYERAMSRMLRQIVVAVRGENRSLLLSVEGLPIEPSPGGAVHSEMTNLRYRSVMNDLSAFVSSRTIVASKTPIAEVMSVRQAMPVAVRLALGRPIYYRTDRGWRMTSGVPNIYREDSEAPQTLMSSTGVSQTAAVSSGGSSSGSTDAGFGGSGGGGGGATGESSGGGNGGSAGATGGSSGGGGGGVLSGTSGVNNRPGNGTSSGGSNGGSGNGGGGGGGTSSGGGGSGSGGSGGSGSAGGEPTGNPFQFLVNEIVYPQVEAKFAQYGAKRSLICDQGFMDQNNDGMFDGTAHMQYYIDYFVPHDYDGVLVLDWEGVAAERLVGPSDALRQLTVQQFVLAVEACKQMRPNALVGMYGLPTRSVYDHGPAWRNREFQLVPVYEAADGLFPSVYDMSKDGESPQHNPEIDTTYVRENLRLALELSGGKPVFAYIWQRWHPSNAIWGMKLIPEPEFKHHLGAIFSAEFQGDVVDGLVWWGADLEWRAWSLEPMPPTDPNYAWHQFLLHHYNSEIPPGVTDVEHFTQIHTATLRQISEVIAEHPSE